MNEDAIPFVAGNVRRLVAYAVDLCVMCGFV
jgi:hypothetical protein